MTIKRARELAAQAWCQETTSQTVLDTVLAEEFAKILVREVNIAVALAHSDHIEENS